MGNPCFDKFKGTDLHELLKKRTQFDDPSTPEGKEAYLKAAKEIQNENLGKAHSIYNKLGVKGYEDKATPIDEAREAAKEMPDTYRQHFIDNTEQSLKEVAEQLHDPKTEEVTRKTFGDKISDIALQLHPKEEITPQQTTTETVLHPFPKSQVNEVVYRGSTGGKFGEGKGVYFTSNKDYADSYTKDMSGKRIGESTVSEYHVDVRNPLRITTGGPFGAAIDRVYDQAVKDGHDAIIVTDQSHPNLNEIVVFDKAKTKKITSETTTETVPKEEQPEFDNFKSHILDHVANVKNNSFDFRITTGLKQEQIEQAVRNIKEGKDTKAAQTLVASIQRMYDEGYVELNTSAGGLSQRIGVPIKEYMAEINKPLKVEDLDHLNTLLGEDAFNHNFDEAYENETKRPTENTEAPTVASAATGKNIEETPSGKGPPTTNTEVLQEAGEESRVTSIQNATVDKERQKRGLTPAFEPARKEFGETWDNAMNRLEENPNAADELVNELKQKTRSLNDEENALLLHKQITLQNAYDKASKAVNEASEKGDKTKIQENKLRLAGLSDALQDVYNVGKSAGTQTARGLVTRKMLAKEDYSLAAMETQKRAANNGRELNDGEKANLQKLHDRITELEAKVKDLEEQASLPKQPKTKSKKTDADFKKERDDILKNIKEKLKKSRGDTQGTLLPYAKELIEISPDVAKLVKSLVEQGVTKLADVVEQIHTHLKEDIPDVTRDDIKDIITGKYEKPKLSRIQSPEEVKTKAELERNKLNFKIELEKDRQKNLGALDKAGDFFVKWERAFKLSSPLTLAKLSMAGIYRTISTPIEEVIGAGYSKVLPSKVVDKAYREAGVNAKAEGKALAAQFTKGIRDAAQTVNLKKGGRSDIEVLYGKEGVRLPPEAADFFGHLHGAIKAPFKRAEFTRSFEKRSAVLISKGIDVSDPMIQMSIGVDAYKDANRAIFMQDNKVSTWWQRHMVGNPQEGDWTGKLRSKVAQFLVPFSKVPTNIVGETVSYVGGLPIGAFKLADAYRKGIEKVTPEEADKIMRMFKKGSIGAGFLLLGYYNPQAIGGYYTGKRTDEDVDVGGLRVFGQDIPKWLVHNPLMESLQIGATVRRVADSYIGNTDEKQGVVKGIVEGGLGLIEEVPFVNVAGQLNKLGNEHDREAFMGEMAKNTLIPAAVQFGAKYTDADVKRKPETISEHIKMGIPGLRQEVSPKHSFTPEQLKSPTIKKWTDKGYTMPRVSPNLIQANNKVTHKEFKLSDYPEATIKDFQNKHDEIFIKELEEVNKRGYVWVNPYGHVSTVYPKHPKEKLTRKNMSELTHKQNTEVLSRTQKRATTATKLKMKFDLDEDEKND